MIYNRRYAVLALLVIGIAGACQPEPEPEPTANPGPVYQPIPAGWCGQLELDEVFTRFDLAARNDPFGQYTEDDDWWHANCSLNADGVTDRFATDVNDSLYLTGVGDFTVYRDPADAEDQQRRTAWAYEDDAEDVTVAPVDGWWEVGHSNEYTKYAGSRGRESPERIITVIVSYTVYDRNFLVQMQLAGEAYEPDVPELNDVLHDLARAVLEDAANHLELTE
jgi:hypothetical protein